MPEIDESRADQKPPAKMLEVDFALVLARLIELAKSDPEQLRGSIYELARRKLEEQCAGEDPREKRRMMQALDAAIQGVEAFSQHRDHIKLAAIPAPSGRDLVAIEPPRTADVYVESRPSPPVIDKAKAKRRSFFPMRALLIIGAAAVVVSAGIYFQRHPNLVAGVRKLVGIKHVVSAEPKAVPAKASAVQLPPQAKPADGQASDALLPKTFGIYAISGNQLFELEPLPGRVPDQRVAISPAITTASRTTLPDGKGRFIVYRRDSVSNGPDRVEVRVIAQVKSAMTFESSGKPKVVTTQDSWVIRNIAFNYRVGPLKDNSDMYEVLSESSDFALPSGRYALVIKGAAYDFSVAGPITDPNQCLQRIEAANGSFYSPCQKN